MTGKIFRKIVSTYFFISCLAMVVCLLIVTADCVNMAESGEFQFLPMLNTVQFQRGENPEEDYEIFVRAVAFRDQLYMNGYGLNDPLWRFINISTAISLYNLLFYCFLHLLDMQLPRWSLRLVQISGGIALLLIIAVRIYVGDCWGSHLIELNYPIAYITLSELLSEIFLSVFVLSVLAGIRKLLRKE